MPTLIDANRSVTTRRVAENWFEDAGSTKIGYPKLPPGKDPKDIGNFVLLDHQNGEYSLLMHMKTGSIKVRSGDHVQQGQIMGRIGFAGDSIFPHLHYSLMDGPEVFKAWGLPAYFSQFQRVLGARSTFGWSPETGYGFSFKKVLRTDESWYDASDKKADAPTLLKLHGSLNWLNSNGYIHRPPSTLDYDKKYIGQHYLAETLYRFPGQPAFGMTVGVPEEGVEVILQLNIVPPILRKQLIGEAENEPLRDVWTLAHQSLTKAERIIVIGYSLPPTDFHAEWLLRTTVQKNEHGKIDLIVVNPDGRVVERLASMFGKKLGALKHFGSFEEFLAS
jgi:murein DD-endopeptidase MepM/ murein hydrolase activator NlpD